MQSLYVYLFVIFATALFSIIYFTMLKFGMNRVTTEEDAKFGNLTYFYTSFLIRFTLAGIFFFLMLKYYRALDELALMVLTFLIVKYFFVRREKQKLSGQKGADDED